MKHRTKPGLGGREQRTDVGLQAERATGFIFDVRDDHLADRVELNALPSDLLIAFIEHRLAQQGVKKVVPDHELLAEDVSLGHPQPADQENRRPRSEKAAVAFPASCRSYAA